MKEITTQFLFVFAIVICSFPVTAQVKIKATTATTAQKVADAEKRLKEIVAKKAAADKILNANLTKVQIVISKQNRRAKSVFSKMFFALQSDNDAHYSTFSMPVNLQNFEPIAGAGNEDTYEFIADDYPTKNGNKNGAFGTHVYYKDLLKYGLTLQGEFKERLATSPIKEGNEWHANFFANFIFSDGTKVNVPFQDLIIGNNTAWKTNSNLVLKKTLSGSIFPDPNNPVVIQEVK